MSKIGMAPADESIELSIGIVTSNRVALVNGCIATVVAACENISHEIIVVDNASTDNTIKMVQEQYPQVILVRNSQNKCYCRSGNQAMALARGKYFLFLNDDTEFERPAIKHLLDFIRMHPQVGVITPQLLYADGAEQDGHKSLFATVALAKVSA